MTDPIILLNDLLAQVERTDSYETPKQTLEKVDEYLSDYKGSYIDLQIIADRASTIAGHILDQIKEDAYYEAQLSGHESKFDHKGNALTPVESHKKYNYPDDDYIQQVEEDMEPISKELSQLKKQEKGLKDSIKSRQKELEELGLAEFVSSNKYLKISKS